jgi:hypothetical protein
MAEKSTSPSESHRLMTGASPDVVETPPRPDVTLALLRDDGLELAVCHADERCDFELLNLTIDPCSTWDEALRVPLQPGRNWRTVNGENGVLLIEREEVERLAVAGEHTVMIRQVTSDGRVSVQSLFRIVDWATA